MPKEWKIFLTAIMYFTRIRVPSTIGHESEYLQKAPKYFPLIGWIVGAISALFFIIFSAFVSMDAGILASILAGVLTTGAFHEDGFADVCDGFGGGWTKEKILLIMKDSRIGAFGAIGLLAIFSSKFLLLKELSGYPGIHGLSGYPGTLRFFVPAIVAAHSLSRLMPVLVIQWSVNVTDPDQSKSKPLTQSKLTLLELVLATLFALAPLAFLPFYFLLMVPSLLLFTFALSSYFRKWIGGYTGDCLGAIQQVTEIVFYLGAVVLWKYI
jgi:adenosylcobinamide-GDP ribazoletransferase